MVLFHLKWREKQLYYLKEIKDKDFLQVWTKDPTKISYIQKKVFYFLNKPFDFVVSILESLSLIYSTGTCMYMYNTNSFPPRPAKTGPFIILLCLMPDDTTHQGRASGWEMAITGPICLSSLIILSLLQ